MDINTIFGGENLKAADLQGREHTVVIESATMKNFNDGNKLILAFQGRKKTFVCNKTNAKRIAFTHGSDTNGWIGREIVLYVDLVEFNNNTVEAIRVRPVARQAPAPAPVRQVSVAAGQVVQERDGYTVSTGAAPHPNAPGVDLEDTF